METLFYADFISKKYGIRDAIQMGKGKCGPEQPALKSLVLRRSRYPAARLKQVAIKVEIINIRKLQQTLFDVFQMLPHRQLGRAGILFD